MLCHRKTMMTMHCLGLKPSSLGANLLHCTHLSRVTIASYRKGRRPGNQHKDHVIVQPYSISSNQLSEITNAGPEHRQAYLHVLSSKAAQQKQNYVLYGKVGNHFNDKVVTKSGLQQSEMVKLHLGLKYLLPDSDLMDMSDSDF